MGFALTTLKVARDWYKHSNGLKKTLKSSLMEKIERKTLWINDFSWHPPLLCSMKAGDAEKRTDGVFIPVYSFCSLFFFASIINGTPGTKTACKNVILFLLDSGGRTEEGKRRRKKSKRGVFIWQKKLCSLKFSNKG